MRSLSCAAILLLASLLLLPSGAGAGELSRDLERFQRLRSAVELDADDVEYVQAERRIVARGRVQIGLEGRSLHADEVVVDLDDQVMVATGNVLLLEGGNRLEGERIEYNYRTNLGVVTNGRAQLDPGVSLRGLEIRRDGERQYSMKQGAFSACAVCQAPGTTPDWEVRASEATVYQDEWITARNATFWAKGIPALYLPALALPIGPRRTGFLIPRIGYSGGDGFKIHQPFFWAISGSQDMTVTGTYRSKRGLEFEGDYRYIFSEQSSGRLFGRYMQNLGASEDQPNRGEVHWQHGQALSATSNFRADLTYVNDRNIYRDDIDASVRQRTQRTVTSNALVDQTTAQYMAMGLIQFTQDLANTSDERASRIPEGRFQWLPGSLFGWPVVGEGEATLAYLGSSSREDVGRFDLRPTLHLPLQLGPWLRATSSLSLRETAYSESTQPGGDSNRLLVEAGQGLASRLVRRFEGKVLGFSRLAHVVEPSLNYLYIPSVDQLSLPQFDRVDFIGPQNRMAYHLVSRLAGDISMADGTLRRHELASLGVEQSWNLQPRRREFSDIYLESLTPEQIGQAVKEVQSLGNGFSQAQERTLSNLVIGGRLSPHPAVALRSTTAVNTERGEVGAVNNTIRYEMEKLFSIEVGQTFVRNLAANGVVGRLQWRINDRLLMDFVTRYDAHAGNFNENGINLRYGVCCWEANLKYTYRTRGPGVSPENGIHLTFDLKTPSPNLSK
jgi:LPS-assembly protein